MAKGSGRIQNLLFKDYGYLKLFFIILCTIAIIQELYVYFIIQPTITRSVKDKMTQDDFPDLMLCPEPSTNPGVLAEHGYYSFYEYISGAEHGWVGQNYSDINELMDNISTINSPYECFDYDSSWTLLDITDENSEEALHYDAVLTRALYPFHHCCKIVWPPMKGDEQMYGLWISYNSTGEYPFLTTKVVLADKLEFSIFRQHEANTFGDSFNVPLDFGGYYEYKISMAQDIHLENNPNYPCIDYKVPGEYDKCLEKEFSGLILQYTNCLPPWLTDNEDLWCYGSPEFKTDRDAKMFTKAIDEIILGRADTGKCSGLLCLLCWINLANNFSSVQTYQVCCQEYWVQSKFNPLRNSDCL